MLKEYGSFVVLQEKRVGQWCVELARMNDGFYEIIMTRSTDCLYTVLCIKFVDDAKYAYNTLTRVKDIMTFYKTSKTWF